jgi:tRNA 2-thiouridine synthesizing protein A
METVDVRGLSCPIPVIRTKKLIDQGITEITVLGDSAVSRENITRLAHSCGYNTKMVLDNKKEWEMLLNK